MTEEEELKLAVCKSEVLLEGKFTPEQATNIALTKLQLDEAARNMLNAENWSQRTRNVHRHLVEKMRAMRGEDPHPEVDVPTKQAKDDFSKAFDDALKRMAKLNFEPPPAILRHEYAARTMLDEPKPESFAHKFRQFLKL